MRSDRYLHIWGCLGASGASLGLLVSESLNYGKGKKTRHHCPMGKLPALQQEDYGSDAMSFVGEE